MPDNVPRAGEPGSGAGEPPPGAPRRPAGALEAEVLAVLQAVGGPLSPGQVQQQLAARRYGDLAYSTVVTILSRLHAKGLLTRQRDGRAFTYTPVDEASFAAGRMSQALDAGPGHDEVLAKFASGLSTRDARLLRRLLADGQPGGPSQPGQPGGSGESG
jgi:predicted transcriptional regulator